MLYTPPNSPIMCGGTSNFEAARSRGWSRGQTMKVAVITTGGTIAKTYDEDAGTLQNERPVVETIVAALRLHDIDVAYHHILYKDSLDMTDDDRQLIFETVVRVVETVDAVLVVHGTDTLEVTGEMLHARLTDLDVPVVLTGAMRPYEFRDSDALQNMTEALLACRLIEPGVYAVMHNRVLRFPGVVKDRKAHSFVKRS